MARSIFSPLPVADTSVNEVSGRPVVLNLLTSLRPGQWATNLLAFAGLFLGWRCPAGRLSSSWASALSADAGAPKLTG